MGITSDTKNRLGTITIGFLVLFAMVQSVAGAEIIFDNGGPTGWDALGSDSDPGGADYWWEAADDFTLDEGSSVITDVHWWGFYLGETVPDVDDFTISFYEADGGPGDLVASYAVTSLTRTGIGLDPFGWEELFEYSAFLPGPLSLTPGTSYYLSIVNNTSDFAGGWYWNSTSSFDPTGAFMRESGGSWDNRSVIGAEYPSLAFRLTGNVTPAHDVVPEPATLSLMAIGLSAGLIRRLRKRA